MLQLNTDCQRRVLDYVNSQSDLKTLCLVSKELNQLALEKLYKRIDIRLYSQGNTGWVLKNLKRVKENLQYTRELVVEDECIAEEIESAQYGNVGLPVLANHSSYFNAENVDPAVRDEQLEQVLDIIPANALRTFRFLARRTLAKSLHKKLASYQTNITDLQLCLFADPDIPNHLPIIFQREKGLKRLDVYIPKSSLTTLLLDNLETVGRSLQSLSLGAQDTLKVSDQIQKHDWKGKRRILPLKELRLTSLRLTDIHNSLSKIIDFNKLLKLDLVECIGSFEFLSDLTGAKPNVHFDLTHVALNDFEAEDAITDPEGESNICLNNFLRACPDLRSLHFGHTSLYSLPPALKQHLKSRGRELKFLSLYSEAAQIDLTDFDLICNSCPNLEQLSAGLDEEFFLTDMGCGNLEEFVNSIRRLRNLRTLHIQRPVINMLGGLSEHYGGRWDAELLAMQMQKFANLMFGELYRDPNFNLETLIIGHLGPLLRDSDVMEDDGVDDQTHYLPQFCFVRSSQKDWLGRTVTTAVAVSRSVLRRKHDCTSILDVDAGVEAWEQWVGQAI